MPLGELPAEIKEANVVIGTLVHERRLTGYHGTIPANEIKRINAEAKNPDVRYLRVFVREPITGGPTTCEKRVHYKCGWFGMRPDGTFNKDFADRMCDR